MVLVENADASSHQGRCRSADPFRSWDSKEAADLIGQEHAPPCRRWCGGRASTDCRRRPFLVPPGFREDGAPEMTLRRM